MPTVTESKISLNLPDNNFFRFQDCLGYKQLQNLKEMDVCWYDQANDTLYLVELKDWHDGTLKEEKDANFSKQKIEEIKNGIANAHIKDLFKKSLDSLNMFAAMLLSKSFAVEQIKKCVPFEITPNTHIKFLSIINWENPDPTYILSVYTAYKTHFMPYAKLFGINTYVVMTKAQAEQQFNWVK